jgi:hypothetical protein
MKTWKLNLTDKDRIALVSTALAIMSMPDKAPARTLLKKLNKIAEISGRIVNQEV